MHLTSPIDLASIAQIERYKTIKMMMFVITNTILRSFASEKIQNLNL